MELILANIEEKGDKRDHVEEEIYLRLQELHKLNDDY